RVRWQGSFLAEGLSNSTFDTALKVATYMVNPKIFSKASGQRVPATLWQNGLSGLRREHLIWHSALPQPPLSSIKGYLMLLKDHSIFSF
ncbi:MAG: hypothetical protein WCA35_03215, partial [Kovacikia sp.]